MLFEVSKLNCGYSEFVFVFFSFVLMLKIKSIVLEYGSSFLECSVFSNDDIWFVVLFMGKGVVM